MSGLTKCLKQMGLSEHESAILRGLENEYSEKGEHNAAVKAVRDYLDDLLGRRSSIIGSIKSAGGNVNSFADEQALHEKDIKDIVSAPARERARERALKRLKINPDRDSLFTAIAKLGGMNKELTISEWGIDPKDMPRSTVIGRPIWRAKGGYTVDGMGEALSQYGYFKLYDDGKYDMHQFEELFGQELRGDPVYSQKGYESLGEDRQADEEARAIAEGDSDREAVFSDESLDESGYNELSVVERRITDDLINNAIAELGEEAVTDIRERVAIGTADKSEGDYHEAIKASLTEAIESHQREASRAPEQVAVSEPQSRVGRGDEPNSKARQGIEQPIENEVDVKSPDVRAGLPDNDSGKSQPALELVGQSAEDAQTAADETVAAENKKQAADRKADEEAKAEREKKEIAQRSQAAADDFSLTTTAAVDKATQKKADEQAANNQLSGSRDMFFAQNETTQTPSLEVVSTSKPQITASEIPSDIIITLPVKVEETGEVHDVEFNAREAFKESSRKVKRLEALAGCLS